MNITINQIDIGCDEEEDESETKTEYVCYLDGCEMRRFDNEEDAISWCNLYDGDKEPYYEAEESEVER